MKDGELSALLVETAAVGAELLDWEFTEERLRLDEDVELGILVVETID